jgi:hypothetical protein
MSVMYRLAGAWLILAAVPFAMGQANAKGVKVYSVREVIDHQASCNCR